MTLRGKLLALFAALGVAPIGTLGLVNHIRSTKAVESLISSRTEEIARRIAAETRDRFELSRADLLLLTDNNETQRLYQAHIDGNAGVLAEARQAADAYLREAWEVIGDCCRRIEFRDAAGTMLYALGPEEPSPRRQAEAGPSDTTAIVLPIASAPGGDVLGKMVATIPTHRLLAADALAASFGRAGYTVVFDRSCQTVLHHPRREYLGQDMSLLLGPDGWDLDAAIFLQESGSFIYNEEDSRRVASFVSLSEPPWTLVSSASLDEFAAPFARSRLVNLISTMLVTLAIFVAFSLVIRRMTGSLKLLTAAADEVAAGNFAPGLPAAGSDEVGRLAAAFSVMVQQVHEMLERVRQSRQMAAIGQFASQISHEIRNPLTSIKLNLQSLERDVRDGLIPGDSARPIEICLREVRRLDRVAGGVLSAARVQPPVRGSCSVHTSLNEALEALAPQLSGQGIVVAAEPRAGEDAVDGDAEQLRGVFLNLFLNAAEAMPGGGCLRVSTEVKEAHHEGGARTIRVRIADQGPGVAPHLKDRIFEPFFSTKDRGTGFGLVLARHSIEEHGGRLTLEDAGSDGGGAVFVVELPLRDGATQP